jgi:hypothetical protein
MPRYETIGQSANHKNVIYDPVSSHAATHLEDTPQLAGLVREVIAGMTLEEDELATYVDLGRVVGSCDVVEVDEGDEIVYGMRKNRTDDGYVPFTKSRQGDPCPYVSVHLIKNSDDAYVLSSAWIGTYGEDDEPFPQSSNATDQSIPFWKKHAFVWGSQEIQPGTIREDCPW